MLHGLDVLQLIGTIFAITTGIILGIKAISKIISDKIDQVDERRRAWDYAAEVQRKKEFKIMTEKMVAEIQVIHDNGNNGNSK
jgi:hypothetical protein